MGTPESLGVDVSCTDDIDPTFRLVTGNRVVAESLYRRLTTPTGALLDAPDDGIDVRMFVSASMTLKQIAGIRQAIERQIRRDERVSDPFVDASFDLGSKTLTIRVRAVGPDGPFDLVLAADKVNTKLLEGPS